ncbi:hypothetical protein MKW92_013655 [Papaver armeniacum]|nr:hypothetical protein MKW92_013655 [Papaver armeniacum]
MEDRNYEGMKTDGGYHIVQLEKGIESGIQVYEYKNHHLIKCAFYIKELHITNVFENEEEAEVEEGEVEEPGEAVVNVLVDNTIHFVYGDIIVPAKYANINVHEATILPNLPGGVNFFVSLDGVKAANQVMKFKFPSKPTRSVVELKLEQRLAHLLLFNNENHHELMAQLGECDNRDTHSEIMLREFLYQCVFDDPRSVYSLDDEGHGVIHLFAFLGYAWAIGILRRLQFTLDHKDAFGWTPLHWAAFHGRGCMTDDTHLGTGQTIEYPSGCTAADIAARRGHDLLVDYLEETRADPSKILRLPALRKKGIESLSRLPNTPVDAKPLISHIKFKECICTNLSSGKERYGTYICTYTW